MTINRLEVTGPNGEEVYFARSVVDPDWLVLVVARGVAEVFDVFDQLRDHYRQVGHGEPVRTVDDRWAACGRVR